MTTTIDKDKELSRVRTQFLTRKNSIFLATVCSSLETRWDTTIAYGATDGKHIYLNPNTFFDLTKEEQIFLLAHETLHVAYMHIKRCGTRDKRLFNIAADFVINSELIEQGFMMIEGGLYDSQYDGMSTEEVYDLLLQNKDKSDEPTNALGDDIQYDEELTQEDIQNITSTLIQASMVATQANQTGSIPSAIKRELAELLKPKVNWKVVLRRFFTDLDKQDYTWRRPKKRYLPQYLPSRHSTQLSKLSIAIDTSGSISVEQFNQFISEVASILRHLKPKELEVIQFDWGIQAIDTVKDVHGLKTIGFTGGGGTDITEVIEHIITKPTKGLIIITDGYLDTDLPKPNQPVIWVVFNNTGFIAPFGQCIHFEL